MMEAILQSDRLENGYQSLLLSYAAGSLDMAQSLAVSTHLEFSDAARNFVQSCEAIGGALMCDDYVPCEMNAGSLDHVLGRLGASMPEAQAKEEAALCPDIDGIAFDIPETLQAPLSAQERVSWRALMPGFHAMDIDLECRQSKARFLKAEPGVKSPHHSHGGMEITVVMDGAFHDETGAYQIGDLIVTDDSFEHAPIACADRGCTCLVVSSAPIKLTGLARVLNPFLKT